jgi:hypothetical protein
MVDVREDAGQTRKCSIALPETPRSVWAPADATEVVASIDPLEGV